MGASRGPDYDQILEYIGQCGKWQWRNFFILWLTSAAGGLAVVVWAFTGYNMPHRCSIPYCDTATSSYFGASDNMTLPEYVTLNQLDTKCSYYVPKNAPASLSCDEYVNMVRNGADSMDVASCAENYDDLIFDESVTKTSLIQDYQLTCGVGNTNRSFVGATYMLGMLFGSFIMGLISDRIGRMKALMISVLCVSISGFLGAFAPAAWLFGVFRFFTGIGGIGCFMITFVLCVEYVGAKYTMLLGIAIDIPSALGEFLLGIEAYYIRDWYSLQLVAYTPLIALLVLWFLVPESPRWLLAKGRTDEAMNIIRKAADVNGKALPDDIMNGASSGIEHGGEERQPTVLDLFRPRSIALRSFNMFYQWFSVTLCYYGLSFASTSLAGDKYTNFMLSVSIEIPGYIFCILVMDCWGRRPILSFCQIISGVSCIGAGLLFGVKGMGTLQVILSLVGKFGASACFAIVYVSYNCSIIPFVTLVFNRDLDHSQVYTAELFPTIIRNSAIGRCSTIARVGGICSLLLGITQSVWVALPMLIMGSVAIVAGILAIFFPETLGERLPETMQEAIDIGSNSNRKLTTCTCPSQFRGED